jgi:glycosyltransferase involved in cell wall biosynthesis
LYTNYGVPTENVAWRPFALYPGHFAPGPDVNECRVIMSGGNHLRDLQTLRLATERLPGGVHPVLLYDQGEPFEGNAHLLYEGHVPLRSFYHAIAHSRFVVVPLRDEVHRAAGVTVMAMALLAGRPVVASSIAATRDYIQDGTEGLLVPPGDPDALADAIARLDGDATLLSRLAIGARETGRRLTTEYWADQIVSGRPLHPVWTPHGWRSW